MFGDVIRNRSSLNLYIWFRVLLTAKLRQHNTLRFRALLPSDLMSVPRPAVCAGPNDNTTIPSTKASKRVFLPPVPMSRVKSVCAVDVKQASAQIVASFALRASCLLWNKIARQCHPASDGPANAWRFVCSLRCCAAFSNLVPPKRNKRNEPRMRGNNVFLPTKRGGNHSEATRDYRPYLAVFESRDPVLCLPLLLLPLGMVVAGK